MPLHIIKLAVGIDDIEHLDARQKRWRNSRGNYQHRTRMTPSRVAEVCPGGSMYWVIRRLVQVRQPIVAFHQKTDDNGRRYCVIELEPRHIAVEPVAKRPFQGWRYLKAEEAPRDLIRGRGGYVDPKMPQELKTELRRLGLI
jgi:hypothetical protein